MRNVCAVNMHPGSVVRSGREKATPGGCPAGTESVSCMAAAVHIWDAVGAGWLISSMPHNGDRPLP